MIFLRRHKRAVVIVKASLELVTETAPGDAQGVAEDRAFAIIEAFIAFFADDTAFVEQEFREACLEGYDGCDEQEDDGE